MELQFARQVVPCVWPGGGMRRAHPAERVELWLNTQLGRGTRRLRRYTRAFRRCPLAPAHTRAASGSRHHALHAYLYNLSANVTLLDTHLFAHWHCGGGDSCAAPAATGSALLAPVPVLQRQLRSGSDSEPQALARTGESPRARSACPIKKVCPGVRVASQPGPLYITIIK